eukprot:gene19194-21116_t
MSTDIICFSKDEVKMYEIQSHPVLQRYKAHYWSTASVFFIVVIALTYILPLLIAYYSQGFWLKESSYREQPEVHFKHNVIVIVQGNDVNTLVAYSTFQNFNNLLGDKVRIPFIQSYETDVNRDGKNDNLQFELQIPLKETENVNSVQLLLFFDYKLHRFSSLQMESMAYIHHTSAISGSEFYTEGELRLKQKYLLPHKGTYTTYNVAIVDSSSVSADAYDLATIFSKYQIRNEYKAKRHDDLMVNSLYLGDCSFSSTLPRKIVSLDKRPTKGRLAESSTSSQISKRLRWKNSFSKP